MMAYTPTYEIGEGDDRELKLSSLLHEIQVSENKIKALNESVKDLETSKKEKEKDLNALEFEIKNKVKEIEQNYEYTKELDSVIASKNEAITLKEGLLAKISRKAIEKEKEVLSLQGVQNNLLNEQEQGQKNLDLQKKQLFEIKKETKDLKTKTSFFEKELQELLKRIEVGKQEIINIEKEKKEKEVRAVNNSVKTLKILEEKNQELFCESELKQKHLLDLQAEIERKNLEFEKVNKSIDDRESKIKEKEEQLVLVEKRVNEKLVDLEKRTKQAIIDKLIKEGFK